MIVQENPPSVGLTLFRGLVGTNQHTFFVPGMKSKTKREIKYLIGDLNDRATNLTAKHGHNPTKWPHKMVAEYTQIVVKLETLYWVLGERADEHIMLPIQ